MSQVSNPVERIRLYLTQLGWAGKYTQRYAADHCMWFDRMCATLKPWIADFRAVRALDLGCGLLQWQTIMLHSLGAEVTGVDMEYVRSDRLPDKYWKLLRTNGLERAAKTAYWDYIFRDRYLQALQNCSPFALQTSHLDLRQHTAERLPFSDNEFDLVASHEVFEHIADVRGAVREIRRVLKPGGIAYTTLHLFTSVSGGHHMDWKFPDEQPSTRVPPWDHLRQKRYPEHPSWLNELRERDYRPIFESEMKILSWEPSLYEGRQLLTAEIKAELPDYSEDELLKKGLIIVTRKE